MPCSLKITAIRDWINLCSAPQLVLTQQNECEHAYGHSRARKGDEGHRQPPNMANNRIAASSTPKSFDASRLDLAGKQLTSFNRYCDLADQRLTSFNRYCELAGVDYALLEPVFRERYVDSEVTHMQRQVAKLQKPQLQGNQWMLICQM